MGMLENVQKRIVKWISPIGRSYKACLEFLGILPLPMYIQVNNLYTLSSKNSVVHLEMNLPRFLVERFFGQRGYVLLHE